MKMTLYLLGATDPLWSQYTRVAPWGWIALWVLVGLLVVMIGWFLYRKVQKRLGGHSHEEMMILKGLEGGDGMTEEERRKVRAALARKYMQPTEEARPGARKGGAGLNPLAELALEAERLEAEARRRAAESRAAESGGTEQQNPQPPARKESEPDTSHEQSSDAKPGKDAATENLPPMLRKLMSKSDIELEDMVAAGLIGEEDMQWVQRVRDGGK